MSMQIRWQLFRFLLVGCLNTAFSYSIYALLLWVGLHFAVANGLAFLISLLFSFMTQSRLVFRQTDLRRLPRFIVVWLGIYAFNVGVIDAFMRAGLSAYAGGALALVPVTVLSFIVQRWIVFRPAEPGVMRPQTTSSTPPADPALKP